MFAIFWANVAYSSIYIYIFQLSLLDHFLVQKVTCMY